MCHPARSGTSVESSPLRSRRPAAGRVGRWARVTAERGSCCTRRYLSGACAARGWRNWWSCRREPRMRTGRARTGTDKHRGWGWERRRVGGRRREKCCLALQSVTSPGVVAVKQLGSDAGGSDEAPPLQPVPTPDPPPGGAGASGDGMVGNPRSKRYGSDREGREVVAAASQQQPGPPPPGSPSPRRPIQTPGVIEATGWQALEPMPGAVGAEENIKGP